jgi:hypothetical protein
MAARQFLLPLSVRRLRANISCLLSAAEVKELLAQQESKNGDRAIVSVVHDSEFGLEVGLQGITADSISEDSSSDNSTMIAAVVIVLLLVAACSLGFFCYTKKNGKEETQEVNRSTNIAYSDNAGRAQQVAYGVPARSEQLN